MILSEALGLLALGVLLGGLALVFAVRFIQNMLFGISAFDPLTLSGTLVLLVLVASSRPRSLLCARLLLIPSRLCGPSS